MPTRPSVPQAASECDVPATRKPRVLLVDDDESIREVLGMALRLEGYEVATAVHGGDAIEWLKREEADLVVVDLMMPVLDGIGFLRAVRDDLGARMPVVVLTGVDREEVAEELEQEGACLVVHKPVALRAMAELLENVWRAWSGQPG